jgi:hypothetical protein
MAFKFEKIM